ncbi:Quaternary ammonium compound-resistance protein SugE [bacterium HR15]|uniref:Quaternary ammonium compound-resistance protein SugE n=1 Tax=uncultured prokaryote TaxID=198431 RepID=H5SN71_9ZZZZ|nr:quaternary ammonium compound-resistance protein SugE [uncultured prokaryote]GBC91654.1 Quaternary ammonium compound-resistance protein SugE [bacterium HR15]
MAWVYLLIAGAMEIVWAVALKLSNGFTRPLPVTIVIVAGLLSLFFLALAARHIPIGTAYAVWTGIGAAGVALVGMLWFHESRDFWRLLCIGLIVAGVIGLRLASPESNGR